MTEQDFINLLQEAAEKANKQVDRFRRLYYNKETGEPIAYTMEELDGDYITITSEEYAQGRYDIIVKDNKILKFESIEYARKLVLNEDGFACTPTNVLIVDNSSDTKWKVKTTIVQ